MSETKSASIAAWIPHLIWLLACTVTFGVLIEQLRQTRIDVHQAEVAFAEHLKWAREKSEQTDQQRFEMRVNMERLSVLLEENSKMIGENNRRLEAVSDHLRTVK